MDRPRPIFFKMFEKFENKVKKKRPNKMIRFCFFFQFKIIIYLKKTKLYVYIYIELNHQIFILTYKKDEISSLFMYSAKMLNEKKII